MTPSIPLINPSEVYKETGYILKGKILGKTKVSPTTSQEKITKSVLPTRRLDKSFSYC